MAKNKRIIEIGEQIKQLQAEKKAIRRQEFIDSITKHFKRPLITGDRIKSDLYDFDGKPVEFEVDSVYDLIGGGFELRCWQVIDGRVMNDPTENVKNGRNGRYSFGVSILRTFKFTLA